ncbi:MAG: energy transducer TonB [Rhodospirillales bacterium]
MDVDGRVLAAKAIKFSDKAFAEPAVESILLSKWSPARRNGKSVAVRVRQRMDFHPGKKKKKRFVAMVFVALPLSGIETNMVPRGRFELPTKSL